MTCIHSQIFYFCYFAKFTASYLVGLGVFERFVYFQKGFKVHEGF